MSLELILWLVGGAINVIVAVVVAYMAVTRRQVELQVKLEELDKRVDRIWRHIEDSSNRRHS